MAEHYCYFQWHAGQVTLTRVVIAQPPVVLSGVDDEPCVGYLLNSDALQEGRCACLSHPVGCVSIWVRVTWVSSEDVNVPVDFVFPHPVEMLDHNDCCNPEDPD